MKSEQMFGIFKGHSVNLIDFLRIRCYGSR